MTASIAVFAAGSWSLTSGEDTGSYEAVASLRQVSADSILDESGKNDVHPALEFRCIPGGDSTIHFRIDWQRFISSFNTEVGFRVDGGKAMWLKLGVDETNNITVSKSSADVDKLFRKLGDADNVELEVAPYSEPSVFVRFDISTFDAALDTLKLSCM